MVWRKWTDLVTWRSLGLWKQSSPNGTVKLYHLSKIKQSTGICPSVPPLCFRTMRKSHLEISDLATNCFSKAVLRRNWATDCKFVGFENVIILFNLSTNCELDFHLQQQTIKVDWMGPCQSESCLGNIAVRCPLSVRVITQNSTFKLLLERRYKLSGYFYRTGKWRQTKQINF